MNIQTHVLTIFLNVPTRSRTCPFHSQLWFTFQFWTQHSIATPIAQIRYSYSYSYSYSYISTQNATASSSETPACIVSPSSSSSSNRCSNSGVVVYTRRSSNNNNSSYCLSIKSIRESAPASTQSETPAPAASAILKAKRPPNVSNSSNTQSKMPAHPTSPLPASILKAKRPPNVFPYSKQNARPTYPFPVLAILKAELLPAWHLSSSSSSSNTQSESPAWRLPLQQQ